MPTSSVHILILIWICSHPHPRAREKDNNFPGSPITALAASFLHFHEKHSPLLKFMAFTNPLPHLGLQALLTLWESEAWLTAFLSILTRSPLKHFWSLFYYGLTVPLYLPNPWFYLQSPSSTQLCTNRFKIPPTHPEIWNPSITDFLSTSLISTVQSYFLFSWWLLFFNHPNPLFMNIVSIMGSVSFPLCLSGYHGLQFQQNFVILDVLPSWLLTMGSLSVSQDYPPPAISAFFIPFPMFLKLAVRSKQKGPQHGQAIKH